MPCFAKERERGREEKGGRGRKRVEGGRAELYYLLRLKKGLSYHMFMENDLER